MKERKKDWVNRVDENATHFFKVKHWSKKNRRLYLYTWPISFLLHKLACAMIILSVISIGIAYIPFGVSISLYEFFTKYFNDLWR